MDDKHILLSLVAGFVCKYAALRWISARRRRECVGEVSRLHVYPLKSARELPGDIQSVDLTKYGIIYKNVGDRHWLVTSKGDMVTMKQNARLTLIHTNIENNTLHLDAEGMETLVLNLDPVVDPQRVVTVTVKQTPLPALDLGDAAASWVCKVLQQTGLRLNFSAPNLRKRLSCKVHKDWKTQVGPDDEVVFQDFGHCMIMCESSMDVLNKRLGNPMSIIPFRPNVMVKGSAPYEEDNWREIYFGEAAAVRYIDNCTRCLITTIDHETALKDKDDQPLKELKKYRCMVPYGPKPCMGIHTVVLKEGVIQVGDPVYVVQK